MSKVGYYSNGLTMVITFSMLFNDWDGTLVGNLTARELSPLAFLAHYKIELFFIKAYKFKGGYSMSIMMVCKIFGKKARVFNLFFLPLANGELWR
jgi:hypothetical protein